MTQSLFDTIITALEAKKCSDDGFYKACCPAHEDTNPSLSIWNGFKKEGIRFHCFSGCPEAEIHAALIAKGIIHSTDELKTKAPRTKKQKIEKDPWEHVCVSKERATEIRPSGSPVALYNYYNAKGLFEQLVTRHVTKDGKKQFYPHSFWQNKDTGEIKLERKAPPSGRSPYRLPELLAHSEAIVLICEGEKATEAAQAMLSLDQYVAITSANGSNAAHLTNWEHLAGRKVVIFPDNDIPSEKYCESLLPLLKSAGVASVAIVPIPKGKPESWDAADAKEEGYTPEQFLALVESATPRDMGDVHDPISFMNATYAVLTSGGNRQILKETYPAHEEGQRVLEFLTPQNLRLNFKNEPPVGETPIVDLWLCHPKRRQFNGIVFVPGLETPGYLNLWRGFSVEPKEGQFPLFMRHLFECICNDNQQLADYILDWLADAVQNPRKRPGTALVLRGKEGIGKGMFVSYVNFWESHFRHISDPQHLVGRFNGHLHDAFLVFADEALYAGDKAATNKLKAFITEDLHTVERKGKDAFQARNYVRLIMASNNDWVVPAGPEARRFVVTTVSDKHMQDTEYFAALKHEMENGGKEALLHFLMHRDISKRNLRKLPQTEALWEQKILSLKPLEKFWFGRLVSGSQVPAAQYWLPEVVCEEFYEAYCLETGRARTKHNGMATEVGMQLRKLVPNLQKKPKHISFKKEEETDFRHKRMYCYIFPPLEQCRAYFDKLMHWSYPWPEADPEGAADAFWNYSLSEKNHR